MRHFWLCALPLAILAAEVRVAEIGGDARTTRAPFAFQCVALKWQGEDAVRIRVNGETRELTPDTHIHGEDQETSSALTCFAQPARAISIEDAPRGTRVYFIDPGATAPGSVTPKGNAAAPAIVSRAQWGAPRDNASPVYSTVTHLIVHHTADGPIADAAAWVRAIWAYHVNVNGWADIGYNYLISADGTIYEGRSGGDRVVGAHFCGRNGNTMGVAVLGTYSRVEPSRASHESLAALLAWRAREWNLDPLGRSRHESSGLTLRTISGHRDGCATECPGDRHYPLLDWVRNETAAGVDGKVRFTPQAASLWGTGARREADWWYGNPATGSYDTPGRANAGVLESTGFVVKEGARVEFESWHDTETSAGFDQRRVEVSVDGGDWVALAIADTPPRQWTALNAALPMGRIRLRFRFDTVDAVGNLYEGWYLRRIRIEGIE
jgi:hypothetical protein